MANINAKDVAALRAKTGVGMMECKKALVEANGDMEEAVKVLRERGLAVAAKKADRVAAEGVVDILVSDDSKTAVMLEVNSETDFVAKNATFQEFVADLLKTILEKRPADVAELNTMKFAQTEMTVEEKMKDLIFQIGENMNIRRFVIVDGLVSSYIHGKGSIGVVVNFEADEAARNNAGFAEFAKNIALQVAAFPVQYLDKESVPASAIEEEKQILINQIKNDEANAKKPEAIIEKMVQGRIGKFYDNNCLTEMLYFKEDSMKVGEYVAKTAKEFGGSIKIANFVRLEKGEGIQKREDNLGDEVAKMLAK